MTILVDGAIWAPAGPVLGPPGERPRALELHAFAARLGLPRASFHDDHYDVTDDLRSRAVRLGARPVAASELAGRFRAAGLRRPADRLTRREGRSSPSA